MIALLLRKLWNFLIDKISCTCAFLFDRDEYQHKESECCSDEPFVASEYLERMERVALDIQSKREEEKPLQATVLWLLLDGLQINNDGSLEWIKRKKSESLPLQNAVFDWKINPPIIVNDKCWLIYNGNGFENTLVISQ